MKLVSRGPKNYLARSNRYDLAPWGVAGVNVFTANNIVSPSEQIDAGTMQTPGGFANRRYQTFSPIMRGSYGTISIYAQENTEEELVIASYNGAVFFAQTIFNLNTGNYTILAGDAALMEDIGDGWYRCSIMDRDWLGTAAHGYYVWLVNAGIVNLWDAQVNPGYGPDPRVRTEEVPLT